MATLRQWRERRLCRRLGITDAAPFRPLIDEALSVGKEGRSLARAYERAAAKAISSTPPAQLPDEQAASVIARKARLAGREAALSRLGIALLPPNANVSRHIDATPLIKKKRFFDLAVHGHLAKNAARMALIRNPESITVERLFAAAGVYRLKVAGAGLERTVFVKEAGMEAEIFASKMLRRAGMLVPDIRNIGYKPPGGTRTEYGVMQDVHEASGPGEASSLRAVARNGRLAGLVVRDLDGFASKLGYAFETFRNLGIQDMHDRNLYVKEADDGAAVAMIDFSVVACYPADESYRHAYAGQLHTVLGSLDFALEFGEAVRKEPQRIRLLVESEGFDSVVARRRELAERMAGSFFAGAERAQSFFMDGRNQRYIRKSFRKHDGKPVGWSGGSKDHQGDGGPVTFQNGSAHRLYSKGPYAGMFPLRWQDAYEKGFMGQVRIRAQDFWRSTLNHLKMRLPDWLDGKGPAGRAATMAY